MKLVSLTTASNDQCTSITSIAGKMIVVLDLVLKPSIFYVTQESEDLANPA